MQKEEEETCLRPNGPAQSVLITPGKGKGKKAKSTETETPDEFVAWGRRRPTPPPRRMFVRRESTANGIGSLA